MKPTISIPRWRRRLLNHNKSVTRIKDASRQLSHQGSILRVTWSRLLLLLAVPFLALMNLLQTLHVSESLATAAALTAVVLPLDSLVTDEEPNFGGLNFSSLHGVPEKDFGRRIDLQDEHRYNEERAAQLRTVDIDATQWSTLLRDPEREKMSNNENACRKSNWQDSVFPSCNSFHEIPPDPERKSLGSGYYRMAWLLKDNHFPVDAVVLKRQLLTAKEPDFQPEVNAESLLMTQREAIIMESLSGSPRIVDIYGHCGTSILLEGMFQTAYNLIIFGSGLGSADQGKLLSLLSMEEKLDLAIAMAESVADLHGFEGGPILNGDISPSQFLYSYDHSNQMILKLNDFNTATMLEWNARDGNYCKANRPPWSGRIYAPEQYLGSPIDESVDVFSMGHVIYSILTGMKPFYDMADHSQVQSKVLNRERPFVDEKYRNNDIEGRLVAIMERMWAHNASDRPDIYEVIHFLKETRQVYRRIHPFSLRGVAKVLNPLNYMSENEPEL